MRTKVRLSEIEDHKNSQEPATKLRRSGFVVISQLKIEFENADFQTKLAADLEAFKIEFPGATKNTFIEDETTRLNNIKTYLQKCIPDYYADFTEYQTINSYLDFIREPDQNRNSQEPKPDRNQNHNSQEPEQIYPYIKYVSREEIKSILSNLEAVKFKETDKQTFAAVAKIIYDKDIINKRKCTNFKKWLNVFSDYYERKTSVYKPNQLKTATEKAIVQYPFLEHDHKGSLQKGNLI